MAFQRRQQNQFRELNFPKNIGITQGALSKMERGKYTPDIIQWTKFCEIVGLGPIKARVELNRSLNFS